MHELANQAMDQQRREMDSAKRRADAKVRRAAKAVVAARAPRKRPESFASTISRHVNSGGRPRARFNSRGQQVLDTDSE